jgi:hypothetical protein
MHPLGKVFPCDLLDGLQLDDQPVFYQQVNAIAAVQACAFVLHLLRILQLEPNSILRALRGEFSVASGLASQPASVLELKLEVATHSKRRFLGSESFCFVNGEKSIQQPQKHQ